MAKTTATAIRTNKLFTLYRTIERKKGRGSKFQWNSKSEYFITYAYTNKPSTVFKSFEDADKEWVYLVLKYL